MMLPSTECYKLEVHCVAPNNGVTHNNTLGHILYDVTMMLT